MNWFWFWLTRPVGLMTVCVCCQHPDRDVETGQVCLGLNEQAS
jgi:hypothetical protein